MLTNIFTKIIPLLLLLLLQTSTCIVAWQHTRVHLPKLGAVFGTDHGDHISYESIPYAEPPVGNLRFAAPMPFSGWPQGFFNATEEAPSCIQWHPFKEPHVQGAEDCLKLNIYKPKGIAAREDSTNLLPVLVFFHGGGFMFGSLYSGGPARLIENGRMIMVSIAYRLGPFGFLSTEDAVIPGNFGLKDQHMAMSWIKQNIQHFGGNPDAIIMSGFSAGGASVHLHMLTPNYANYAKVGVSFSGCALNPWVIMQKARARAFEMAQHLNCPHLSDSQQILHCLRNIPAADIINAIQYFLVLKSNPFTTFGPVVESPEMGAAAFITAPPKQLIESGNFTSIPWLVSYVTQDGAFNSAELLQKTTADNELIEILNEHWYNMAPPMFFYQHRFDDQQKLHDYSTQLKIQYFGNRDAQFSLETYPQFERMATDLLFKNGIEESLRLHKHTAATAALYSYVYDNPADKPTLSFIAKRYDVPLGTIHGDDVFLALPNPKRPSILREDQHTIARKLVHMLEDFVENSTQLNFGNCSFRNNMGSDRLQFMYITRDKCENQQAEQLPSVLLNVKKN